jgi:hypothetical protein
MRAIMQWALGMMQDAAGTTPKPPAAGAPVPITIVMNAGPSSLRTRMSLDWGKFMKLMEESMPK